MTTRSIFPLALVLLIAGLGVFYSFTNTYMACADQFGKVGRERADLYAMCDELSELSVPLAALSYKHLQQIQPRIVALEDCRTRLAARSSMAGMADACDTLCETVSNLVGALNASPAADSGEYTDLRAKLGDTLHQVVIAKATYAKAIESYNNLLEQPVASLWRSFMGFKPADPFVRPRKPVQTVFPPEETKPAATQTAKATIRTTAKPGAVQTNKPMARPIAVQTNKPSARSAAAMARPAPKPAPASATSASATNAAPAHDPFRS